jgi:hypothetical protein
LFVAWDWFSFGGFGFLSFRQRGAVHKKQIALHGGPKRLSVRAVKGAFFAFTGAKRKPLTEEADGSGAGFSQEGQCERTVREGWVSQSGYSP